MRFIVIILFCVVELISCNKIDKNVVVSAKTTLSSVNTYIGDALTYEVRILSRKDIDYSFSDVSFDEREDISRILSVNNKTKEIGNYKERIIKYKVAFYDSGQFVISPFTISYNYEGKDINIYGESMNVIVYPFSDGDVIPPMKGTLSIKMTNYVWITLIIISILIVLLIFALFRIKNIYKYSKKKIEREDKEALLSIDILDYNTFFEKKKYSEYYFELTYIFRRYLTKRFSYAIIDMTTIEVENMLPYNSIDGQDRVINFLKESDYIKFAKKVPSLGDMKRDFDFCKDYIKNNGSVIDIKVK